MPSRARERFTSGWCSRCCLRRLTSIRPRGPRALLAGGQACRPLIARDGLSAVLVEPAIKLLRDKGANIQFGHELREFGMSAGSVGELKFGDNTVAIDPAEAVVM